MVPSHKIIADRFELIFSYPPLDFGGWDLILHETIAHALEEAVRSGKMCRLLEVLQELVPVLLSDIMRGERVGVSGSGHRRQQGETVL
jgi:hypothetical protein